MEEQEDFRADFVSVAAAVLGETEEDTEEEGRKIRGGEGLGLGVEIMRVYEAARVGQSRDILGRCEVLCVCVLGGGGWGGGGGGGGAEFGESFSLLLFYPVRE